MADDDEMTFGPGADPADPPSEPVSELPALDADTVTVKRGSGRARLAIGVVVGLGIVAAGLAVVISGGDDIDPQRALAAAQAVVESSESFTFEQLQVSRVEIGDPDGAGSDTTTRSLTKGTVAAADRWRIEEDLGFGFGIESETYETIRIGDTVYSQGAFAMPGEEVVGPTWIAGPSDQLEMSVDDLAAMYGEIEELPEDEMMGGFDDGYKLDLAIGAYLLESSGQPTEITRLVSAATDPQVEQQLSDGGVVLRARLAPVAELAEVAAEPIPAVDVLLELDAEDRPQLVRFTASAGTASADVEVKFSDWGADLAVDPPAEGDIDRTPWIQEEALLEVDPALLAAPSVLPPGMELSGASVWPGDPDYDECESVELSYSSEVEAAAFDGADPLPSPEEMEAFYDDLEYLSMSVSLLSCVEELDDSPFDEELGGLPSRGEYDYVEVKLGNAVVQVDSTYDEETLATVVASLRPVSVDELVALIPDWVQSFAQPPFMGPGPAFSALAGLVG
ncbi:MAG: hypothetical protein ACOYXM_18500 [Actinomycetota bacterium]